MNVLLYKGGLRLVVRSGVGKAVRHQEEALNIAGIPCTYDTNEDYDVAHFNTVFPDSFLMARAAKIRGKKVIYYGHSTMEDFKNSFCGSNIFAPFFKLWIKACYNSGDIIITPTPYSKRILESYGIKKPIIAISNGIDLNKYQRDPERGLRFREKYGIGQSEKVVISVGHYIERKGILEFVELAKRNPEYRFMWFGYTNLNLIPANIRNAIQTNLPNLDFPGYVPEEELIDVYNGSDLFLFLTKEETEGIVLLEAMATEIPILVNDIPIYKEWLPENKVVYKGRSVEEFEQRMKDILKGELPDLTEAAKAVVKANSINKIGDQLKSIYGSLVREKKIFWINRHLVSDFHKRPSNRVTSCSALAQNSVQRKKG